MLVTEGTRKEKIHAMIERKAERARHAVALDGDRSGALATVGGDAG